MRLFRRSRDVEAPDDPVAAFWSWWQESGADLTAAALADREPVRVADELSRRVAAIADGLTWELSAGGRSSHLLVVSPEGDPDLRATARRWLRSAPAATATWGYADTRQPVQDVDAVELETEGATVAFRDIVVSARREGLRLSVAVHHPSFAHLDDAARETIASLALDSAIGESDVECWIGEVARPRLAPLDAFPLRWVRKLVSDFKAEHTSPDGEPHQVVFQGQGAEGPILAMAQVPLAAATAPELDTHVGVFLEYLAAEDGLPTPGALEELRHFEDALTLDLAGRGRVVAHQSSAGTRVLHVFVDGTSDAADRVRAASRRWTQGSAGVTETHDPSWSMVAHLRG